MNKQLEIGTLMSGAKFVLPLDLVTHTLAVIGIRGWGKTVAATVIAEEFCECGLPWIAIDPVGVWFGLRCSPDGTPGGYPVLVVGGQHGDLPLEKDKGAEVAEAILQENLCCVVDMSGESKNAVRHFVTDFCDRLMEFRPQVPRHIFLEEAPELIPQKPMGEQKRSLAAVDRLVRLGRNQGYGCTLISQRYATVNKDTLTQVESLLAGRMIGKTDRKASEEWIGEVASALFSNRKADKFVDSLAGLDSGHGWFLSPQWDNRFVEVQIRQRKTYHPGATRSAGQAPKQVQLSDVKEFVERFSRVLKSDPRLAIQTRHVRKDDQSTREGLREAYGVATSTNVRLYDETAGLRQTIEDQAAQIRELSQKLKVRDTVIKNIRARFEPDHQMFQDLFGDMDRVAVSGNHHQNADVYEPWKERLGGGMAKMIDALLKHGELTRTQLATVAGLSSNSGTYSNYISKLNSNGLLEKEGDKLRLRKI